MIEICALKMDQDWFVLLDLLVLVLNPLNKLVDGHSSLVLMCKYSFCIDVCNILELSISQETYSAF